MRITVINKKPFKIFRWDFAEGRFQTFRPVNMEYGMVDAGSQVFLESKPLDELIAKFFMRIKKIMKEHSKKEVVRSFVLPHLQITGAKRTHPPINKR